MEKASLAFHCAINRGLVPDGIACGILIHGYCKVGRTVQGLVLYGRMFICRIMPDAVIQGTIVEHILETDRRNYDSTPNHMICRKRAVV